MSVNCLIRYASSQRWSWIWEAWRSYCRLLQFLLVGGRFPKALAFNFTLLNANKKVHSCFGRNIWLFFYILSLLPLYHVHSFAARNLARWSYKDIFLVDMVSFFHWPWISWTYEGNSRWAWNDCFGIFYQHDISSGYFLIVRPSTIESDL